MRLLRSLRRCFPAFTAAPHACCVTEAEPEVASIVMLQKARAVTDTPRRAHCGRVAFAAAPVAWFFAHRTLFRVRLLFQAVLVICEHTEMPELAMLRRRRPSFLRAHSRSCHTPLPLRHAGDCTKELVAWILQVASRQLAWHAPRISAQRPSPQTWGGRRTRATHQGCRRR